MSSKERNGNHKKKIKMEKKTKVIPESINVGVYYYKDEATGKIEFDFEEMADEFERELSKLDDSVVVMVSVE